MMGPDIFQDSGMTSSQELLSLLEEPNIPIFIFYTRISINITLAYKYTNINQTKAISVMTWNLNTSCSHFTQKHLDKIL